MFCNITLHVHLNNRRTFYVLEHLRNANFIKKNTYKCTFHIKISSSKINKGEIISFNLLCFSLMQEKYHLKLNYWLWYPIWWCPSMPGWWIWYNFLYSRSVCVICVPGILCFKISRSTFYILCIWLMLLHPQSRGIGPTREHTSIFYVLYKFIGISARPEVPWGSTPVSRVNISFVSICK